MEIEGLMAYDGYKFNEDGFELEFNVKKTKEAYYAHIESINSFVAKMCEKRNIMDAICLLH